MEFPLLFALLIGLFSSLFASTLVIALLYSLKPTIKISPEIAKKEDHEGNIAYHFKVINKSWFKVFDVKVQLSMLEEYNVQKGQNVRQAKIKLVHDYSWHIDSNFRNKKATYALIFYTREDLEAKWDSSRISFQLKIIAKHALSGFGKVFTQTYYTKGNYIKNGMFEWGNSFNIS